MMGATPVRRAAYDPFRTPEGAQMPEPFGYTGEGQDVATELVDLRVR